MKRIQVFDWSKCPHELAERLSENYCVSNDTYVRFFPKGGSCLDPQLFEDTLAWLQTQGLEMEDDDHFHVLIEFSW